MKTAFRRSFARDLKKLKGRAVLDRAREVIEQVEAAADPEAINDLTKLSGTANAYRIRVRDYRVGVTIEGDVVELVRFLHRRDLYRFFPCQSGRIAAEPALDGGLMWQLVLPPIAAIPVR